MTSWRFRPLGESRSFQDGEFWKFDPDLLIVFRCIFFVYLLPSACYWRLLFKGEFALRGPKLGVFRLPVSPCTSTILFIFRPDPKRHHLTSEHAFWAINHGNWSVGTGCARTWENCVKNGKKDTQRWISRLRGGGTPVGGMMKLGKLVEPLDMNSLWASGGSQKRFSLWNAWL
jgi:hypothetical protein